jgi:hypothetical protein
MVTITNRDKERESGRREKSRGDSERKGGRGKDRERSKVKEENQSGADKVHRD